MLNGDESSAFQLVRQGYDVWLGNSRGNRYSRRHRYLTPSKHPRFFDFSFYEMARYDLPAQIDYVRAKTGVEKLAYIGHSEGTTSMFTALAEDFG